MATSRFSLAEAVRSSLPLFVGLCGPSGCGKTFSALRLGIGIQRVAGGTLALIDTEANRALHYADRFKFLHMPFTPPFSPDDYVEALQVAIASGAKTIILDSMSHEHEGPGGVLEWHEAEVERLSEVWKQPAAAVQFPAWAEPKASRRRLLNFILQQRVNLICCFRAKRKVEMPKKGSASRQPLDMGWMPVAGPEYAYEMTALGVLPPGARGVPDWSPLDPGSEMVTKRPAQFERILEQGKELSEDMGEGMARWALGEKAEAKKSKLSSVTVDALKAMGSVSTILELQALFDSLDVSLINHAEAALLQKAFKKRREQL